tara:strand:- start:2252 stop:2479 length:228 start_codon:yes stop_codon:yes gene_type:complete
MLKTIAASVQEIAQHISTMTMNGDTPYSRAQSRGMTNPHAAYSAGYDAACADIAEILNNTIILSETQIDRIEQND